MLEASLEGLSRVGPRFPLEETVTEEQFAGRQYWIRWRGNYAIQLAPREARIPFFEAMGP